MNKKEEEMEKENQNPNKTIKIKSKNHLLHEIEDFCKGNKEDQEENLINKNLDINFFAQNLESAIKVNQHLNRNNLDSEFFYDIQKKFIKISSIGKNKKLFHFNKIFIFEKIIYILSEKKKFNQFFFNFQNTIFGIYENGIYINFHSKMITKKIFLLKTKNFFSENLENKKNYPKIKILQNEIGFRIKNKDEFFRVKFREDFFIKNKKYKLLFKMKKNKNKVNIKCFDFTDINLLLEKRKDYNLFFHFFKRHKKFFRSIYFNNDIISLKNFENLINFLISEKIYFFNLFCISNFNHYYNHDNYFLYITNKNYDIVINDKNFKGFIFDFFNEDIFFINDDIFLLEEKDFDQENQVYGLKNVNFVEFWNSVLKIELFNY